MYAFNLVGIYMYYKVSTCTCSILELLRCMIIMSCTCIASIQLLLIIMMILFRNFWLKMVDTLEVGKNTTILLMFD